MTDEQKATIGAFAVSSAGAGIFGSGPRNIAKELRKIGIPARCYDPPFPDAALRASAREGRVKTKGPLMAKAAKDRNEYFRLYQQRLRADRKAAKKCIQCGKRAAKDAVRCRTHLEENRATQAALRAESVE